MGSLVAQLYEECKAENARLRAEIEVLRSGGEVSKYAEMINASRIQVELLTATIDDLRSNEALLKRIIEYLIDN